MQNPTTTTVVAPIPPKWAKDYDLSELAEILRKKTHPGEGYRRIKGAELVALQAYFDHESRKLLRSHFGRNVQRGVWLWPLKPEIGTNKMRAGLS